MRASFLVEHLNEMRNANNSLELKSYTEYMEIIPKEHQTNYNNELSLLINNYKMDNIIVGALTFFGKYKVFDNYLAFANIEMDYLALNIDNDEIVLLDHDDTSFVMLKCAKNANSFIEVLFYYFNHTFYRITKHNKYKVKELFKIYELAGGGEYKKFVDFIFT